MLQKESNNNNNNNKPHDERRQKKKLYNPFHKDQDYYSVNEKLPIQIKSKIPHWIPTNNSDIFEVRKVMVSEKEELRALNRSLGVYKQDNKILISKNILEEEAKKQNRKIRTDLTLRVMKEEKSKKGFDTHIGKNYIKKVNYNVNNNVFNNKQNQKISEESNFNCGDTTEFENDNKIKNIAARTLLSGDKNTESAAALAHSYRNLNTVDKIEFRKNKANIKVINRTTRMNSAADFNFIDPTSKKKNNNQNLKANEAKAVAEKNKNKKDDNYNYDTHKANTSVLITSLIHETPAFIDTALRKECQKEYKQKFETSILHELKEEKEENELKAEKTEKDPKKNNKLAKSAAFEPPITSTLRYSVREYINKTREVVLLRHSVEIKKESACKMEENYTNQIQSVRESITSLKHTKNLFEDNFIVKFDLYVRYLRLQREKELNDLNSILEFKSKLEYDIQKLETRKFKTKAKLSLFREYRDFLISVKERTVCLPAFFTQNENYKNNITVNLIEFGNTINSKQQLSKHLIDNSNSKMSLKNVNSLNNDNETIIINNVNNNGSHCDLEYMNMDNDEEEKSKIIQEKEKLLQRRNTLLNQLQASSPTAANDTFPNSPMNGTSKNVSGILSNNNIFMNKNLKKNNCNNSKNVQNAINIRECFNVPADASNSNSKSNSGVNSPKKKLPNNFNDNQSSINKKLTTEKTLDNANLITSKKNTIINIINLNNNFLTTNNSQNQNFKNELNNKKNPTLFGVEKAMIEKFNNYITKPIYETTEELNEEIKKLQHENINLLKKLTATSAKGNIMKQQLEKIKKEDKGEVLALQLEVLQREEKIKKIKEINLSLQGEKSMLLAIGNGSYGSKPPALAASKDCKSTDNTANVVKGNDAGNLYKKPYLRKSLVKAKFNEAMLYSKVAEIFNFMMELPMNAQEKKDLNANNLNNNNNNSIIIKEEASSANEKSSSSSENNNNFILNMSFANTANANKSPLSTSLKGKGAAATQIDREANLLRMLRFIEKTVDCCLLKNSYFLQDPKKSLHMEKLKNEVEKDRKVRKAIETRLKDEKRQEIKSQAIIERNNRPIILPNKRFDERFKPVEKKVTSESVYKNKAETSIYDLIIYS